MYPPPTTVCECPLVSVIVPIYNVEKYLSRCIDSVLAQTYKNFELILVDDGSNDECPAICDEYKTRDERIKVIHKNNGGLSSARNEGLDVATGKYISFIDSDDYVAANFIERLYFSLNENKADIALCNFSCVDEDGNFLEGNAKNFFVCENEALDEKEFWSVWRSGCVACSVAWSKLYEKSIFSSGLRFPFGKINEDEYILHYVAQKCERFSFVNDALYFYTQRKNSIMGCLSQKINFDSFDAFSARYEYFLQKGWADLADCVMEGIFSVLNTKRKNFENQLLAFKKKTCELQKLSKHKHSVKFFADSFLFLLGLPFYDFCHKVFSATKRAIKKIRR